jgi:hypothetical protein
MEHGVAEDEVERAVGEGKRRGLAAGGLDLESQTGPGEMSVATTSSTKPARMRLSPK